MKDKGLRLVSLIIAIAIVFPRLGLAAPSHAYIPAKYCHRYPGPNFVTSGDTGGADPKFTWNFPAGVNDVNTILCEFAYPESATTNSFNIGLTYQANSNDGTKNACWFVSGSITLNFFPWSENLGNGGGSAVQVSTPATGGDPNTDQSTSANGMTFFENDDNITPCTQADCKNKHGQIFIQRQLQVSCADEIPVDLQLEFVDVSWTP